MYQVVGCSFHCNLLFLISRMSTYIHFTLVRSRLESTSVVWNSYFYWCEQTWTCPTEYFRRPFKRFFPCDRLTWFQILSFSFENFWFSSSYSVYIRDNSLLNMWSWSKIYPGRAVAQAVSHRLPTAAALVPVQVRSCDICGGQSGTGAGFLRVLRFPLPILIHRLLLIHRHLSSGASTIGPIVADVPSGLSLTPPKKLKNKKNYPFARYSSSANVIVDTQTYLELIVICYGTS
jgi:hypothetical protein